MQKVNGMGWAGAGRDEGAQEQAAERQGCLGQSCKSCSIACLGGSLGAMLLTPLQLFGCHADLEIACRPVPMDKQEVMIEPGPGQTCPARNWKNSAYAISK